MERLAQQVERVGIVNVLLLVVALSLAVRLKTVFVQINVALKLFLDFRLKRADQKTKFELQKQQLARGIQLRRGKPSVGGP